MTARKTRSSYLPECHNMASNLDAVEALILQEAQDAEGRTLAAHFPPRDPFEPSCEEIEFVVRALDVNPMQFARRYLRNERELKRMTDLARELYLMKEEWESWRETLSRLRLWETV